MGKQDKNKEQEDFEISGQPRPPACFVFRLGRTSQSVKNLKRDFRIAFLPNTAQRLKERRSNTLRDFLALAGPLGVTHFLSFTQSLKGVGNPYLRIAKTPKGPTLTFKIKSFATMKDVVKLQRRPHQLSLKDKEASPLVVLNNFSGAEEHLKLTSVMLQNLFPPLNVREVNLRQCRRVVLFNFNKQTNEVEFRHYVISIKPSSSSTPRRINKIMKGKIPKLGNYKDISDYVLGEPSGYSDSEVDDPSIDTEAIFPHAKKQKYRKKKQDTGIQQTAVRLHEVGPRINMELIKIQGDLFSGKVLYHRYIKKTQKEIDDLERKHAEKNRLKKERKLQQEKNVEAKKKKKKGAQDEDDEDDDLFQDNEDFKDNHSDDEQDDVFNEFDDDDLDDLHEEQDEEEEQSTNNNNNTKKAGKPAETKQSKKSDKKSSSKKRKADSSDDEEEDDDEDE